MPLSSVAGYRGGGWQPHRPVELIPLPGSPVEKGQQTCPAQPTVSGLLQKTEFAHVAPRPTVEHRLSQLGAKAKLRAPTHRNRVGPERQPVLSSALPASGACSG